MDLQVWKRFVKRKSSVFGGIIIMTFFIVAIFGPFLAPYDPLAQNLERNYEGPSYDHLMGTDNLGRDVFSRLIHGARISLGISLASVTIGVTAGMILGIVGGYYGGWIDNILMRFVDIMLAFPGLLLAIAIIAILGPGVLNTIIAVAFYSIPYFARIVRASVISIVSTDFVQAARAVGASDLRIILTHIIPNSMSQIIVVSTLRLGQAIITASGLSFLGLGVQPPYPEWGAMLSKARAMIRSVPVAAIAPGTAITLVVLSFSLLGDGLRDALDPKLKNKL
jgi:peptide/nickel transport system permease protein